MAPHDGADRSVHPTGPGVGSELLLLVWWHAVGRPPPVTAAAARWERYGPVLAIVIGQGRVVVGLPTTDDIHLLVACRTRIHH